MSLSMLTAPAAALVLALGAVAASTADDALPVTVVGDSVLTAVEWNNTPLTLLSAGLDLQLDIGVCRTIEGVSCPFEGGRVPTLIDVVNALGTRLGPTVLVEVGYNDPPGDFARRVEDAIDALLANGVQRILWVNMRAWKARYAGMNQTLAEVAIRHRELAVIDWEGYSQAHYSWFQGDGVHLTYDGAVAMATFLNTRTRELLNPLRAVTPSLPVGWVGRPYSAQLSASGGLPPYRWRVTSGPLPHGLHLLANGLIVGTPRRPARLALTLQTADGGDATARFSATLVIREGAAPAP